MTTLAEAQLLRDLTDDAVVLAQQDARTVLRGVDLNDLSRQRPELQAAVGDVIDGYGYGVAALTADWYSSARAESPATGRYIPVPVVGLDTPTLAGVVGWAVGPLYSAEPDMALALRRLDGGVQRTVANAARFTVIDNTYRDPARARYYRGAQADCCAFCAMLAARGPTYKNEASAGFDAHDHDRCQAVPLWPGERLDVPEYYADFTLEYEAAAKAARRAGEPVVAPRGRNRRDTVLWRMRQATGRK